jgi:hypothetical protein
MRLRLLVVLVAAGLSGGALAVQGCGSGTDATGGGDGPDATEAGAREAGDPDVTSRAPPCDPKAELFAQVHDASIGDGASTTGVCLGCARAKCDDAIMKCTTDCPCQGIVGRSLECYLTTQQIGCAYDLTNYLVTAETRKDALALLGCVQSECPVECVVDAGATSDASDAGTD